MHYNIHLLDILISTNQTLERDDEFTGLIRSQPYKAPLGSGGTIDEIGIMEMQRTNLQQLCGPMSI